MGAGSAARWVAMAAAGLLPAAAARAAGPAPAARVCDASVCVAAGGGAIVREHAGGAPETRHPALLRDATVEALAVHGDQVWLGLGRANGEPLGLVRYDWAAGGAHAFRGTDSGPCGFAIHDLLVRDGTLWVATELGVSRLGLAPDGWDEWTHFATGPAGALEETACATLLSAAVEAAPGDARLARRLAEFRPRFWRRHVRRAAATRR